MKVTLRQIESFLAVAESGSFSRAARDLGMGQPALSQAVRDLEAELAVRLLDRTTRRVELTEAGREFRNSGAKVLEDLGSAIRSVNDLAGRRRGRIRIAAPPLLAAVVLPQAIAEFRRLHSGISVELSDVGTEEIVEKIRSGDADCGVGTFPPSDGGIERVTLMRDSLMLFCAEAHPLARAKAATFGDLAGLPLITLTRDSGIRLLVEVGFETAQIPCQPAFEVSQITTALALVEAGLGIAVLPTYALTATGHLKVAGRILSEPRIAREVVLIHATGRSVSPATTAFAAVLKRYAKSLSPQVGRAKV